MQIKIDFDQIFNRSHLIGLRNGVNLQGVGQTQWEMMGSTDIGRYKMDGKILGQSLVKLQKNYNQQCKIGVLSNNNSCEFGEKIPGERLYYESKEYINKKNQELEKIRRDKTLEEDRQNTFKPKINKNTQRILHNKIKNPIHPNKIKNNERISTKIKKQQEQYNHCTFKPELIAKSSSKILRTKQKDKVFEQLYKDQKIKDNKLKLKIEQNNKIIKEKKKKCTKQQFQNFLIRNNQFINKIQKKQQLIIQTSKLFDLQTGKKLFSPKINTIKSHKNYFSNCAQLKTTHYSQQFSPIAAQFHPKGIFSKNSSSHQQPQPIFKLNHSLWKKIPKNPVPNMVHEDLQEEKCEIEQLGSLDIHLEKFQPRTNEDSKVEENKGDDGVQSSKNINSNTSTPDSSQCSSEQNEKNQFITTSNQ